LAQALSAPVVFLAEPPSAAHLGPMAPKKRPAAAAAGGPVKRRPAAVAKVGDAVPAVDLHKGFPPEKVALREFCRGKKVVLVGLPGAFTPT